MNNYTDRLQRDADTYDSPKPPTPLTQEGEDIRKEYMIMKDGFELIKSSLSAVLAYSKNDMAPGIVRELRKISATIQMVIDGTNTPHSSTMQSISTIPSTAENKEWRNERTVNEDLSFCKPSGIDKEEETHAILLLNNIFGECEETEHDAATYIESIKDMINAFFVRHCKDTSLKCECGETLAIYCKGKCPYVKPEEKNTSVTEGRQEESECLFCGNRHNAFEDCGTVTEGKEDKKCRICHGDKQIKLQNRQGEAYYEDCEFCDGTGLAPSEPSTIPVVKEGKEIVGHFKYDHVNQTEEFVPVVDSTDILKKWLSTKHPAIAATKKHVGYSQDDVSEIIDVARQYTKSNAVVDYEKEAVLEVIRKRIAYFNGLQHHTFHSKELTKALKTIDENIPPSYFQMSSPSDQKTASDIYDKAYLAGLSGYPVGSKFFNSDKQILLSSIPPSDTNCKEQ